MFRGKGLVESKGGLGIKAYWEEIGPFNKNKRENRGASQKRNYRAPRACKICAPPRWGELPQVEKN